MKNVYVLSLALICMFSSELFAEGRKEAQGSRDESVVLKLSHSYEPSTAFHEWALWASEEIDARTDGRYRIEVFPSGALGTEREVEEALTLGTVDLAFVGPGHMAQTYAPISIHLAAFLWRDIDHFLKYPESETYSEVTTEYMNRSGNRILALTYFGQRHVTSNIELQTPEDFVGLKMRVPPVSDLHDIPQCRRCEQHPHQLQRVVFGPPAGVVVAQENPLPTIQAKKFYEVQDYIILTGHMTDGFYTLAGDHVWSMLSDADQTIFREVYAKAALETTKAIIENEKTLVRWFEDQGIEVIEVDRARFIDAVADSMTGDDLPWTQEQIDELKGR